MPICWHQGVPLPWLELFEHLTSIWLPAAAARSIPGPWRWRRAERPGSSGLIAGSVQGALMMPFTAAKIWIGLLRLGRLPGDIVVERQNFTLYFPITSGLLISVALTLFLWLVNW